MQKNKEKNSIDIKNNANGCKYFRKINDKVETVRIVGIQGSNVVKLKRSDNSIVKVDFDKEIVQKDYNKLRPDFMVTISIVDVEIGENKSMSDVVIMIYKMQENSSVITSPDIVCRQNVRDIFADFILANGNPDMMYAGMSMSTESCPVDYDFNALLIASKLLYTSVVYGYKDDDIRDLIKMVNVSKYDKVLDALYSERLKNVRIEFPDKEIDETKSLFGWSKNLMMLVEDNNVQFDINSIFKITEITTEIDYIKTEDGDAILTPYFIELLSNAVQINISSAFVIPYTREIDINNISESYLYIKDINKKMWIVIYESAGDFVPKDAEIKDVIDKMKTLNNFVNYNLQKYI